MPSTIINRSCITDDVKKRLIKLDESLNEGDITKKGYSKQKWSILESYLPDRILNDYKGLQNDLEDGNIVEKLFYDKLFDLLSEENIYEIFLNAEKNTKNVIQSSNSESDIKPGSSAKLQNFIYDSESVNEKDSYSKQKNGNKINNSASTSENNIEDKKYIEIHDHNGINNKSKGDSTNTIKSMFERKRKNQKTETETEMNTDKKIKIETEEIKEEIVVEDDEKIKISLKRCEICKQRLDNPDLKFYPGHPPNAVEEFVALTDPKLSLFTGDEEDVHDDDQRPQNKVTFFTVYDKEGHLCSFDSGLIECNAHIYFSGYMKAVYEENPSIEGGVPTKDMGPINEWWISGFDGGEHALLGFSTAFADYYLMEPSEEYRPFLLAVREKIHLSKLVIEFLLDEVLQQPTYEDLLNKLETSIPAPGMSAINEEMLLRHAQFICDQVTSVDASNNDEEQCLITAPCMRSLIKLAGVTFGKRKAIRHTERKTQPKIKKPVWSKATTTTLVREVFETFFVDQIDSSQKSAAAKRKRCGVCEACQRPDCGDCNACRDMCKFGGSGRAKQACRLRRCPNMAIAEADESEIEEEDPVEDTAVESNKKKRWYVHANTSDAASRAVEWTSEVAARHAGRTYYSTASVGGVSVGPGDCVMLAPRETGRPLLVARVAYMWQEDVGSRKMFHAHYFIRGSDTVLGETADSRELFLVNDCESIPLGSIVRQAVVTHRKPSPSWAMNGGLDTLPESLEDDGQHFFFQKKYDPDLARFEDPLVEEKPSENGPEGYKPCASCRYNSEITASNRPQLFDASENNTWSSLLWRGRYYNEGVGVYLDPETFKFKVAIPENNTKISNKKDFDSNTYPEFYRKTETVRGSNMETSNPFCIGVIKTITYKQKDDGKPIKTEDVKLQVYKMYRPENTHKGVTLGQQFDFNALYWSDELKDITLAQVEGQCFIACGEALNIPVDKWSALGPNRFYFNQMYNVDKQEFSDVPTRLLSMGMEGKGKGVGKGIKKKSSSETKCKPETFTPVLRPLRALDVFAGCGGLSEGLNQAEIAKSEWAIEKEEPAAHAYKLNNSSATVFTEDCNELLRLVIDGKNTTSRGQKLPQRGDVELLCGGPPCQGFSGMNRFNAGQYSLFKNSLIVSYLSYCDYYRPKFFILENVRNFVSFKRGLVLKLTLRCLIAMGYQCTFGVLQAGNYGVPQTRRRLIILAAAPGQKLPMYPEPTHVFSKQACKLTVMVDEKKFSTNVKWSNSAPYRTVTVRDAMWDLPTVRNGHKLEEMSYDSESQSHFQRLMRGDQYQPVLRDHICKEMAPIVEARMSFIPTAPGSDWRDLPNIITRLSDGSYTRKLVYSYYDKQKKLRGVCACFEGKPCCPTDRQDNTLIPWCLPHTADRHNHWAGLYGRLEWDGFFSTTITNPEPMGKQGRVLHPSQNRVVSVRECARSQGFPDTYRFFGNILDKHRQVGNAVPPPMARQIGFEIRKCLKDDDE